MANNNNANVPVWVLPLLIIPVAILVAFLVVAGMGDKVRFNPFKPKHYRRSGYCSRCGMFGGACKCPKGKCGCGK